MVKVHIMIFILISSLMLIADAQILHKKSEKVAKFRVYVHDVIGGPNATVHEVARAKITPTSPTSLGQVFVADDLMTAGPDANSQKLGRVQGLVVNSGLEELSFTINGIFLFMASDYSGSTLSIFGWKLMSDNNPELPIVGGTGIFRMARGYTISNLYSYDPKTNYYLFAFDIHVVYEEEGSGWLRNECNV